MAEKTRLLTFEEFRAASNTPLAEAVRQARAYSRSRARAEKVLRSAETLSLGWAEWPDGVAKI